MSFQIARPFETRVPLAGWTTLEVGGPVRYLARCRDAEELIEILDWVRRGRLDAFVLGGGSNLLVADAGFDGVAIQLDDDSVELEAQGDRTLVKAGAGAGWDALVARTVAEGLGGLECLSGIPGRVGAAPMQNVGAYGQEVSETVAAVHVVDRATSRRRLLPGDHCGFGYRTSHFKEAWRDRYVITRVDFLLPRRETGTVRYRDLKRRFQTTKGAPAPSLAEVREAVLEVRRGKSMVIEPDDENRRSAGSFFTNPIVEPEVAARIRRRSRGPMPAFPADGGFKLSAAWLIEQAGFARGYAMGRAALSSRHALALVNLGGATAAGIVALARTVRRGVREAFGVTLEPEPVFVGFGTDVDTLLG